jgi:hypothetical protein
MNQKDRWKRKNLSNFWHLAETIPVPVLLPRLFPTLTRWVQCESRSCVFKKTQLAITGLSLVTQPWFFYALISKELKKKAART